MMNILEYIKGPWHWSISGVLIACVMFALLLFGKEFGLSDTYRTMCSLFVGKRFSSFFRTDVSDQKWNLVLAFGIVVGSYLTNTFLINKGPIEISSDSSLSDVYGLFGENVDTQKNNFQVMPIEIFSISALSQFQNICFVVLGGFLSGFGARYAGGCTSGHFISGLSNLQVPSFITMIFFMLGGYLSSTFIVPLFVK